MSDGEGKGQRMVRKEMGWPAAATLITAMVGAAATTMAWGVSPLPPVDPPRAMASASQRELGEIKARLTAIEESNRQLRTELRSDLKDLRDLVQQVLQKQ